MATRYTTRATGQHATAVQFCLTLRKPLQSFQGDGSMGSPHACRSLLTSNHLEPNGSLSSQGLRNYLLPGHHHFQYHSSVIITPHIPRSPLRPSIRPTVRSTNGNKEIPFSIQFSLFFFYRIDSARSADSITSYIRPVRYICMYGNVPYIRFL